MGQCTYTRDLTHRFGTYRCKGYWALYSSCVATTTVVNVVFTYDCCQLPERTCYLSRRAACPTRPEDWLSFPSRVNFNDDSAPDARPEPDHCKSLARPTRSCICFVGNSWTPRQPLSCNLAARERCDRRLCKDCSRMHQHSPLLERPDAQG